MQILNHKKEFNTLKMKESKSVKFTNKLFQVDNEIRVLDEELKD